MRKDSHLASCCGIIQRFRVTIQQPKATKSMVLLDQVDFGMIFIVLLYVVKGYNQTFKTLKWCKKGFSPRLFLIIMQIKMGKKKEKKTEWEFEISPRWNALNPMYGNVYKKKWMAYVWFYGYMVTVNWNLKKKKINVVNIWWEEMRYGWECLLWESNELWVIIMRCWFSPINHFQLCWPYAKRMSLADGPANGKAYSAWNENRFGEVREGILAWRLQDKAPLLIPTYCTSIFHS